MPQSYATFNNTVDTDNTFFGALTKGLQGTAQLKQADAAVQNTQLHNAALQQLLSDHAQDHKLQNQLLQAQIQNQQAQAQVASRTVDTKVAGESQQLLATKALIDEHNLNMETTLKLRPSLLQAKDLENQLTKNTLKFQGPMEGARLKALETQTAAQQQGIDFNNSNKQLSLARGWGEYATQQAKTAQVQAETQNLNKTGLLMDSQLRVNALDKSLKVMAAVSSLPPGSKAAVLQSISPDDPDLGWMRKNPEVLDDKNFVNSLTDELMKNPATAAQTYLLQHGMPATEVFPSMGPDVTLGDPTKKYREAFQGILGSGELDKSGKPVDSGLIGRQKAKMQKEKEALNSSAAPLPGTVMVAPQLPAGSGEVQATPVQEKTTQETKQKPSEISNNLMDTLSRNDQHFKANKSAADDPQAYESYKQGGPSDGKGKALFDSIDTVPTQYSPLQPKLKKKTGPLGDNDIDVYDNKEYPYPTLSSDPIRSQIDSLIKKGEDLAPTYRSASTNTALLLAVRKAVVTGQDPKPVLLSFKKSPYLNDLTQLQRENLNDLLKSLVKQE